MSVLSSAAAGPPELLAPAGDWDVLRAACANGADAVYFGLSEFNARHRAANFTPTELPKVIDFLHARNVRGFVALNILIFGDELVDAARYVRLIAEAGADAVIVQDLGLASLIRRMAPDLHIHASTQMTLTEPRAVEFARDRLNIRRAVLARELSVADVRTVAGQTTVPLEVFVHGALCVAYSGQCLTSEALGGRSANRGQCAQACRLPYEMVVDGVPRDLGDRAYLLSPQDLAGHEFVADLIAAGVVGFKIEGRLKGPHYVAATTQTYREAIDAATAGQAFAISEVQRRDLEQTFSRGFTPGFLEGVDHQRLVRGRVPKSRGLMIGTVLGTTRRGVRVGVMEAGILSAGDGVVFDLGKPAEKEPGGRIWEVIAPGRGREVELVFEDGFNVSTVPVGVTVWKTDDPVMKKRLERSYATDPIARRTPVWMTAEGAIGGPFRLSVRDDAGRTAAAEWPGPIEEARKHPLTADALREQLARLGDTPLELAGVESRLPANAMLPKSVLNDVRRQAIAALMVQRAAAAGVAVVEPDALARVREEIRARNPPATNRPPKSAVTVLVRTAEQLDAVLPLKPAMVYCDFEDGRRYKDAVAKAKEAGVPIGLATMRILKPGEEGFLKALLQTEPDAVLIRNLGAMLYCREHAPTLPQVGDFSLNVANEITADLLMREGFARLVPSYDLNWEQFAALISRGNPDWFEPVIHQHMPMFHMEHCVIAATLSNGKDWRDCGRPCDRHRIDLKDRVGATFPVTPDAGCRNTVFNAMPQSAAEYVGKMQVLGLRRFRVEMLRENATAAAALLTTYRRVLGGAEAASDAWRSLKAMNQLGVTRGTLQVV